LRVVWCDPTFQERDATLIERPGFGEFAATSADHPECAECRDEFQVVRSDPLRLYAEGLA
jgi:hypothetical protein